MQQTRSETRTWLEAPVRVFGLDSSGNTINQTAWTVDISRRGVRLKGVNFRVKPGETIGLRNGPEKARFKVVWIGDPASPLQGQMGLLCLETGKYIWGPDPAAELAEAAAVDAATTAPPAHPTPSMPAPQFAGRANRRRYSRYRTAGGAKVQEVGAGAAQWTMLHNVNRGGCYVETSSPLPPGTPVDVTIHTRDVQIAARGEVTVSDRMVGMGVRFTKLTPLNQQRLDTLLHELASSGAPLA